MARKIEQKTVTVDVEERTWRTEIESAHGQVPIVTAHREIVQVDPDGNVVHRETGITVRRDFQSLVDSGDQVTVGKKNYTAAEMPAVISAFIDKWREADLQALAAAARVGQRQEPDEEEE
jgi:hypothetical protein